MRRVSPPAILAGLALALVIALFAFTVLYALASQLRSHDPTVLRALLADDLFASLRHAWAHRWRPEAQINAAIAGASAVAVAAALTLAALHRRSSPLGDAAFITLGEARSAGFLSKHGLFFGRLGGLTFSRQVVQRDFITGRRETARRLRLIGGRHLRHPRLVHAFVTGPTRSGKGASLIIPNALLWPHSLVVLDIRGETFEATAGQRARFSKVHRFAPGQGASHGYNPLDFVRREPGLYETDIRAIAASMVPTLGQDDEYWTKDARELVGGVIAWVLESGKVADRSLRSVIGVLMGETDVIDRIAKVLLEEGETLSPFARRSLTPFLSMAEKQFSGLYGNLRVALQPFANELTLRATSFSSFRLADFRREATTLYIDFRLSQVASVAPAVNLLLTQLVNHLTEERMQPGERPVLMLLDEFSNLGRLEPVLSMWKVLAGNGVAVWAFVQSLTDLDRFYGRDGRNVIVDNSELQIFLGGQSPEALEHFEKLVGQTSVSVSSRSTSGGFFSAQRSHSTSTREVAVPLMSRDALRRLDPDRFLVLPMGEKPILARKNYFFGDPALRRLAGLPMPKGWRPPPLGGAQAVPVGSTPSTSAAMLGGASRPPGAIFRREAARRPVNAEPSLEVGPGPSAGTTDDLVAALEDLSALGEMMKADDAPRFGALLVELAAKAAELAEDEDRSTDSATTASSPSPAQVG